MAEPSYRDGASRGWLFLLALVGLALLCLWLGERLFAPESPPAPAATPAASQAHEKPPTHFSLAAGWGSRPEDFGRLHPQEGNPEAPMSLAVGRGGEVAVLDQVNDRVRLFANGQSRVLPLKLRAPQDLVVAPDGRVLVLDRLGDRQVCVVGGACFSLAGKIDGGTTSGLFLDGNGVYVEHAHEELVRVGALDDSDGEPTLPGRPTADGSAFVKAGIINRKQGTFYVSVIDRASLALRFTRALTVAPPLWSLDLFDTDDLGTVYVAAHGDAAILLICLDAVSGETLGTTLVPPSTVPDEAFRSFSVNPSGGVLYGFRSEAGYAVQSYDCR